MNGQSRRSSTRSTAPIGSASLRGASSSHTATGARNKTGLISIQGDHRGGSGQPRRPSRLGLLGRLELCELLLRRQLLALWRDDELQLGDDVGEHLERHRVAADPLDRRPSRACAGRRGSSAPPRAGRRRSSPSPSRTARRSGRRSRRSAARALEPLGDRAAPRRPLFASCRARCASRFSSSRTSPGVATSASPRGSRKLRA